MSKKKPYESPKHGPPHKAILVRDLDEVFKKFETFPKTGKTVSKLVNAYKIVFEKYFEKQLAEDLATEQTDNHVRSMFGLEERKIFMPTPEQIKRFEKK